MCASSSTSQSLAPFIQEQAPLPLIRCPWCNNGDVQWWVSQTPKNPGKHFYKCENHWTGKCDFWKWEPVYLEVLRAKWPRLFITAPSEASNRRATLMWILLIGVLNLAGVLHLYPKNY